MTGLGALPTIMLHALRGIITCSSLAASGNRTEISNRPTSSS